MTDFLFSSQRCFRLWLYTVSHRTLLLRSVKGKGATTRVDIIFKPVSQLRLPTELDGIRVRAVLPSGATPEVTALLEKCGPDEKLYSLSGDNLDGWVMAGMVAWHEDEGDYGDPSHFSVPRMVW
ncbi:MAG: hypothetical protein QM765_33230 [Myxococcales bacterium]